MNKKLLAGTAVFVFIVPVIFMRPFEETGVVEYLTQCVMPLMIAAVFWINLLWLMPHCGFTDKERHTVIVRNAVLVAVFCTIAAVWHSVEFRMFIENRVQEYRPPHQLDTRFYVICILRDAMNFVIAALMAYTYSLSCHARTLQQKQQEADSALRDAELRMLRNQVSPHFLLNTLNNIYALSAISTERTQGAVMQLSRMLRHMLYDNQAGEVTLQSEVEFIRSYVDLMRLRLANNIRVETDINVSEEGATQKIAPLLFISLVENAFKHGVSPTEQCYIRISLTEAEHTVTCCIENSNHPKQSSDRSGHGIGVQNVQQRLDMLYPGRYTWEKGVTTDGKTYCSKIQLNLKPSNL